MSLADPQSVTISAVAHAMARTGNPKDAGYYQSDDGLYQFSVQHAYGKRTRRAIKLTVSKIAADPLISANNIRYSMSVTLVVDVPVTGFTVAEALAIITGFFVSLQASSYATVSKVLGSES